MKPYVSGQPAVTDRGKWWRLLRGVGPIFVHDFDATAFASGASFPIATPIHNDSDFIVYDFVGSSGTTAQRTGGALTDWTCRFYRGSKSRGLSTIALPGDQLFGVAKDPYVLPLPWLLRANDTLVAELTNVSAGTRYARFYAVGTRVYDRSLIPPQLLHREPFVHHAMTPLTGTATEIPISFTTHGTDGPFVWVYTTATLDGVWDVQIEDDGSGRNYNRLGFHSDCWLRICQEAYYWPLPIVLHPNSEVVFNVTPLSGEAQFLKIMAHGFYAKDLVGQSEPAVVQRLLEEGWI